MKTRLILIILTLTTTLTFSNDFIDYINIGDSCYAKFDLQNAYNYYKKAYDAEPKDYNALLKITRVCNDLCEYYYELRDEESSEKNVNLAVSNAEKFYSLFPDSAKVYAFLAWSYGNQALFKGGKEKIKLAHKIKDNAELAIQMDSTDYLPYIILSIYNRQIASLSWFERLFANTFFGDVPEGSFEESERLMLKALKLKPGIIIALFHLSLTYKEMDETQKEIKVLKQIIESPERDFRDKFAKRKAQRRLEELLD